MSIRQKAPPNLAGAANVYFNENAYDALIWQKGYNVVIDSAVYCPCKSNNGNIPTCQNCKGTGWLFINPYKTRALITSINYSTQYKDWSLEKLGTINVTVRESDRISYFDRITFSDDYSVFSEVLTLRYDEADDQLFMFPSYKVANVLDIFLYESDNKKLIRLVAGTDYEINPTNPYIINLNYDVSDVPNFNGKVSIRYRHNIQYNIIDLPHETRKSYKINDKGQDQKIDLPVHAVARRVHNIEAFALIPEYGGSDIQDNSYL